MTAGYLRPTKAKIDCKAIFHNVQTEKERLNKETELFAVVKANGYGHGAVEVANIAKQAGATGFCVAILDEALELRSAGITDPILVLGMVDPGHIGYLLKENLTCAAISPEWLEAVIKNWPSDNKSKLKIHAKIDSGMGRVGLRSAEEINQFLEIIEAHPEFDLEGIFTHFSKADSSDKSYFELQQARFSKALSLFPKALSYVHTSNSATALWHDHWQSNLVRFGAAMYGLNPSGRELTPPYELKQAMTLETELVQVKKLEAEEGISYGATYYTESEEWIGTLPIGYADGLTRNFQGFKVLVDGEACPIVGRICMDQCMVKLPREYPVGTKVVIFGDDEKGNSISFQDAAEYIGTINYEIPCVLSERVPLVYVNECD